MVALMISGCAVSLPPSESFESHEAPDTPDFSGPFASDYAQAWSESDSEFVRLVVRDEEVSEQEWAEVESRMSTCFSDAGATFEGYTPDGGYAAQKNSLSSERMNEVMGECEKSTGEAWIGYLWFTPQTNPQNTPAEEIITECMIRNGVVGPDYTPEDFLRDNPAMSFPYLDAENGQKGFLECNADPSAGT